MLDINQIREALQDRVDSKVAEATGLSAQTIWRIKTGKVNKPHNSVLRVLSEYLERPINTQQND